MLAKKFALGFGIAVIFPMMIHYGVATFVHEPKWQEYHNAEDYGVSGLNMSQEEKKDLAARRKQSQATWKRDQKQFQRTLFSVAAPLGIVAIILGSLITIQAIGTGLMFGGIFSVLDGYFNYWSELPDGARFVSLLLAFIVLIYIGWRKMAR
jgi:hypothetical protein